MLAPQPVLQPRGSSIHVFQRAAALSQLGYAVDLLTYPLGEAVDLPGVRVMRVWRPWGMQRIRIGPSPAKLILDLLMAESALRCLARRRYLAIHSHEEAAFIGLPCARLFRLPHLYDMHSSLPQQLENWRKGYARLLAPPFRALERMAIRGSDVVVTISPMLSEHVRELAPDKHEVLIENTARLTDKPTEEEIDAVRAQYGLDGIPTVVYAGNLEPYQGIDLLLASFAIVRSTISQARLLIVGGSPADVERYRQRAAVNGLQDAVSFAGTVPAPQIGRYLACADVLVSPRVAGTNTPMKLYAYLQAGRPIVATDLSTHTQVLSRSVARLAAPEPGALGEALICVLTDAKLAAGLVEAARWFSQRHLGDSTYRERIARAYELLLNRSAAWRTGTNERE